MAGRHSDFTREERLAAQLRANLRRRKEQSRARRPAGPGEPDADHDGDRRPDRGARDGGDHPPASALPKRGEDG